MLLATHWCSGLIYSVDRLLSNVKVLVANTSGGAAARGVSSPPHAIVALQLWAARVFRPRCPAILPNCRWYVHATGTLEGLWHYQPQYQSQVTPTYILSGLCYGAGDRRRRRKSHQFDPCWQMKILCLSPVGARAAAGPGQLQHPRPRRSRRRSKHG